MGTADSRKELIARLLAARDYDHLVELLAEATAIAVGSAPHCQSLLLSHPEVSGVCIRLFRKEGQTMRGRPYRPKEESQKSLPPGAVLVREDFERFLAPFSLDLEGLSPAAILAIPLLCRERCAGLFLASFMEPPPELSKSALGFIEEVQRAFDTVVASCHELEKFRRQRNELQEVFEAATMLQGGHELEEIGDAAADLMVDRLGFDRALVLVRRPRTEGLFVAGHRGFEEAPAKSIPVTEEDGSLISKSYFGTMPMWEQLSRRQLHPTAPAAGGDEESVWNVICLPLIDSDGKSLGVLYGDHNADLAQMSVERFIGLQLFANSLGSRLENAHLLSQVAELAEQDGLTGLANRRSFDAHLRREVARARRQELPLSILMIDINKFKELNDTYGHVVGDEVLIQTADLLQECVRETDVVARYGGDEFVILMPDTGLIDGNRVRSRILESVERMAPKMNREHWTFRLSCGLKCAITDASIELLDQADKALYAHKMAQVRRGLLQKIVASDEEQLLHWDHYLGKLLRVLFEKDPGAFDHCRRVMNLCIAICGQLNQDKEFTESVALAAMLHDVGKISIPGSMLNRAGPLTPEEYRVVQSHTKIGYDLLREVNYLGDVCEFVRFHHERYDGVSAGVKYSGYPGKLKGEQIPLGARILKVAASFDAMVSIRPYKPQKTNSGALAELRAEAGKSFDPRIVALFASWMDRMLSYALETAGYE